MLEIDIWYIYKLYERRNDMYDLIQQLSTETLLWLLAVHEKRNRFLTMDDETRIRVLIAKREEEKHTNLP